MANNSVLHDRSAAAILDAAATVLAEQGGAANMADVAEAAGVGRATLYRYFPSRDDLIQALVGAALDDAERRVADAELTDVAVPDALARLARALVGCGAKFAFLMNDRTHLDRSEVERRLGEPFRAVFHRGLDDGTLRPDVSADLLAELFGGMVAAAVRMTTRSNIGIERASATMTAVFLDGARSRPDM